MCVCVCVCVCVCPHPRGLTRLYEFAMRIVNSVCCSAFSYYTFWGVTSVCSAPYLNLQLKRTY